MEGQIVRSSGGTQMAHEAPLGGLSINEGLYRVGSEVEGTEMRVGSLEAEMRSSSLWGGCVTNRRNCFSEVRRGVNGHSRILPC
jgi:hypothetical protein